MTCTVFVYILPLLRFSFPAIHNANISQSLKVNSVISGHGKSCRNLRGPYDHCISLHQPPCPRYAWIYRRLDSTSLQDRSARVFFFWDSLRWGSKLFIQGNSVWEVRPSSKQKQKVHQLEFFLCDILWRVPCNAQIRFFILILSCELLCMLQYQIWLLPRWNKLLILDYFIAQNYTSLPCMYLVWIQDHREPTKEQISRYHRGQGFYKCIIRPRQP
jgi:hypothetical protein